MRGQSADERQRAELPEPPDLRAPSDLRAAPEVLEPAVDDFADPPAALARVPAGFEPPVAAFEPAADLLPPDVFADDAFALVPDDALEEPPPLRVRPPRFDPPLSPASGLTLLTASPTLSTAFDTVLRMFSGTLITLFLSLVVPDLAAHRAAARGLSADAARIGPANPYAEAVTPGPAASRPSTAWSTPPLR